MSAVEHRIPVERLIDATPERFDFAEMVAALTPPWKVQAACTPDDADLFWPERGEDADTAKRICSGCPVRRECLTYALRSNERDGIWGGMSGKERRRLRREHSLSAIAAMELPEIRYTAEARAEANRGRVRSGGRFTAEAIAATVAEIGPRRATGRILEGASR